MPHLCASPSATDSAYNYLAANTGHKAALCPVLLAAWQAMGRPNGPSVAQLKVLVAASEVTPVPLAVSNGAVGRQQSCISRWGARKGS